VTILAHVYHKQPGAEGQSFTPENFKLVAEVDLTPEWKSFEADPHWLEAAFEMTNSHDRGWHEKTPSLVGPTRSTSTGDIVVLLREGEPSVWQVAGTGWTPLASAQGKGSPRSKILYKVLYWIHDHACGVLSTFETEKEAEECGRNWQDEMISATPGTAENDYPYEVQPFEVTSDLENLRAERDRQRRSRLGP